MRRRDPLLSGANTLHRSHQPQVKQYVVGSHVQRRTRLQHLDGAGDLLVGEGTDVTGCVTEQR
jgi:hypothetical protein